MQVLTWREEQRGDYPILGFEANSSDIDKFWSNPNVFDQIGVTISLSYIPGTGIGANPVRQTYRKPASSRYVIGSNYAPTRWLGKTV
ncbi:hypothetical protein ABFW00_24725 [Mycobacteroides abscessus]|uniref:hypothetical protein n=1 Tax=Mycobacteroides abscessus TaxID=36809 RepID=UPI00130005A0|nr:hypothetical protein [Mycobacteroides abscessus]